MSNPSRAAREANPGFTETKARHRHGITLHNPATGKCCFETQVGQIYHRLDGQEADSAWEQDAVADYLKMVKCDFNLRARKLFNGGDLVTWSDPASGKYVKFQPQNLQWIGDYDSNSVISTAQAISTPVIEEEDELYWANAFGSGRHFRYTASTTCLIKHLILDQGSLPACPTYITNPWLELTFSLTPSADVTIYIDGVAWDNRTAKTTANRIEFRLSTGEVVWSLAAPKAFDSSGDPETCECAGQIRIYVNKKIKYCGVRFLKSWIDAATFPIYLDPTVDYQVGASADDCHWRGTTYANNATNLVFGRTAGGVYKAAFRFPGITIPDDAIIDSSYCSFYFDSYVGTPPACTLYAEDAANPSAISGYSDGDGRSLTTANISVTGPTSGDWHSGSLNALFAELRGSYSYESGAAVLFIVVGGGASGANYSAVKSWDYAGNVSGPKLHIEYTEAAAGNPFYAYAQQ